METEMSQTKPFNIFFLHHAFGDSESAEGPTSDTDLHGNDEELYNQSLAFDTTLTSETELPVNQVMTESSNVDANMLQIEHDWAALSTEDDYAENDDYAYSQPRHD